MAATTKLIVYNDALREIGASPLANLVTANKKLLELDGAFNHAVEYILSVGDWNFARRRTTLTGTADGSVTPYGYRYTRPSDYLRKLWIKASADEEFEVEHAEIGSVIYAVPQTALMEYMSDHADNYDPANWPPHVTRCVVVYLALLVAPTIAGVAQASVEDHYKKLDAAIASAKQIEDLRTNSVEILAERDAIMRRVLELIGQQIGGNVALNSQVNAIRWQINRTWSDCVRYVLEQAPWNFATRRATLTGTSDTTSFPPYTYRYARPTGFLKRTWIRQAATDAFEADYAESGTSIYGTVTSLVMEYTAQDSTTLTVANWPATFSETLARYLAAQVAGTITVTDGKDGAQISASSLRDALYQQFAVYLEGATKAEAITFWQKSVPAVRLPVMRRALELMGTAIAGPGVADEQAHKLRWQMNQAWDHTVRWVLEQGAWNFATKRALLTAGADGDTYVPSVSVSGIIEGYVSGTETDTEDAPSLSGYTYAYPLPEDLRHKIWIKTRSTHDYECAHQIMGSYIFTNLDPCILEYIGEDSTTTNPENWPATVVELVAARLALAVVPELVAEADAKGRFKVQAAGIRTRLDDVAARALSDAKNKDAIQQEPKVIPPGRFVQARMGGTGTSTFRRYL